MQEDIEFKALDGVVLRGTHYKVDRARAVCLFLHGITTSRDEFLGLHKQLAASLREIQTASLLIDFRAHGKSDGRQIDFSPIGQSLDAAAAISFLGDRYDLIHTPLSIVGTSFGAFPSILSARRFPKLVRQLFLFAPVTNYWRTFLEPETEWARASFTPKALNEIETKGFLLLDDSFKIGARLVYEMMTIDPVREAQRTTQPIIVVHGKQDSMVPVQTSIDFTRRVPHSRLIEMEEMDHGFSTPGDDDGTSPRSRENLMLIEGRLRDFIMQSVP